MIKLVYQSVSLICLCCTFQNFCFLDLRVAGDIGGQKADEALLLHHRGPVCEWPVAGAALSGESQP